MRFEITLRVTTPDGEIQEREVLVLDKGHDRHEATGLSIAEAKALLKSLQQKIVEAQAEAFCASKSICSCCGRRLRRKGSCSIRYRTVFGDIPVTKPAILSMRLQGSSSADLQPPDRPASRPHGAGVAVAGNQMGLAGLLRRRHQSSQGRSAHR